MNLDHRIAKALQLLAVAPVAGMSLLGVFLGLMAIGSAAATRSILGSLLIALILFAPALMVLSLCVAILTPPADLRARDRLAGAVALGLVSGSILSVVLIYMEIDDQGPPAGLTLLMFAVPLGLAIVHAVRIAKAKSPAPLE